LDTLTADLEQVQSRIRETSPQYAALTQPAPLNLMEIQTKVLDEGTVLLEYALGSEKSFVFAVTPSSMEVFELPPRAEIESAARRVYDLLTARNQNPPKETPAARASRVRQSDEAYFSAAAKAGRMLLGPVASKIENKRLLVVGEGVLQYLPFAALPEPGTAEQRKASPLIANHEIITAPSASVMAVLRRETAGRKPAERAVAILADPVFSADDVRIAKQKDKAGITAATSDTASNAGHRSRAGLGGQNFLRLRFSRNEADAIARLAPVGATLKALDFAANRETATSAALGDYRIVHFATHGFFNAAAPMMSSLRRMDHFCE
jgi:CHAT domain-containing protein